MPHLTALRSSSLAFVALLAACGTGSNQEEIGASSSGDPTTGAPTTDQDAFLARLQQLVAPHVDPSGVPGKAVGMVVSASAPGVRVSVGFGASWIGGPLPRPDTTFEIGSATKVVTGLLLARALDRGDVALADPIDPLFPLGAPQFAGQSITLLDLATHSSDLPRMPDNTHSPDPLNPGAGYTEQDLADFMASYTLGAAPGTRLLYSNLGAGVLGYYLVERTGLADYPALVRRDLAEPLRMNNTWVIVPEADPNRVARGYRQGVAAPANELGEPLAGAGALRSTGADMLLFLESALGAGDPAVVSAWAHVLEPRRPSPQGQDGQLGLLLARETLDGRYLYFKDGQTAGFSSYLVFSTSPPAAVMLLANSSDLAETGALRTLAREIFNALLAS